MTGLLHENLERVAACLPQQTAFRCDQQRLSWSELNQRATEFAAALQAIGVQAGDRVAIRSDLSVDAVVVIYGILKTGAAYVPIDATAGCERICEILRECGTRILIAVSLSDAQQQTILQQTATLKWLIASPAAADLPQVRSLSAFCRAAPPFVRPALTPRQPAYVIFTSGSTGRPKGIVHTHQSAQAYARLTAETYDLSAADTVAGVCPLHFDMSTCALFAAVYAAASTVLMPGPVLRFPASVSARLAEAGVSVLYCVPYLLIQLLEHGVLEHRELTALRWIIFAGETFPVASFQALRQRLSHVAFSNAYGPAETNVCSVRQFAPWEEQPEPDRTEVPIGRLWGDAVGRVVDAEDVVVEPGQAGELLVHASTVMSHYDGRSAEDPAAFCVCPQTGRRFYRTGDLVRQNARGELLFLGRRDRQVKVRGHRVELDAIESALTQFPDVLEASVQALSVGATNELSAQYTSRDDRDLDAPLRDWLRSVLPAWAQPARLARVAAFTRTSSGKIDHQRTLAAPANIPLTTHQNRE